MMFRFLFILLFMAVPAQAQVMLRMCVTKTFVEKVFVPKYPGSHVRYLKPGQVATFMRNYNAFPPTTRYKATEISLLYLAQNRRVVAIFFDKKCAIAKDATLTPKLIDKFLGKMPSSNI